MNKENIGSFKLDNLKSFHKNLNKNLKNNLNSSKISESERKITNNTNNTNNSNIILKTENDIKNLIFNIKKSLKIEHLNFNFNPNLNNYTKTDILDINFKMDEDDMDILEFIKNSNKNKKFDDGTYFNFVLIHYDNNWYIFDILKIKFLKVDYDDKDFEKYIKQINFPSIIQYENKKYIISGGFEKNTFKSNKKLFIIELTENNFLRIKNEGELPKGLYYHNTLVLDEKIYIFGGNEKKILINHDLYQSDFDDLNFGLLKKFETYQIGYYYGYMFGLNQMIFIITSNKIIIFSTINENFKIFDNYINLHGMEFFPELNDDNLYIYLVGGVNIKVNRFDSYLPTKCVIKYDLIKNKKHIISFLNAGRSYGICVNKLSKILFIGGNNENNDLSGEYNNKEIEVPLDVIDKENCMINNLKDCTYSKDTKLFLNNFTFSNINKTIDNNKKYLNLFQNINLKEYFCFFGFLSNLNYEYFVKINKDFSDFSIIENDWGIFNFKINNICYYDDKKMSIYFILNEIREFMLIKYIKKQEKLNIELINNENCNFLEQFKYVFKNIEIINENYFVNYGRAQIFQNSYCFCLLFILNNEEEKIKNIEVLDIKIDYLKNILNDMDGNNLFNFIIPHENDINDNFYSKYIKEELMNKNLNYLKTFFFSYKNKILFTFANSTNFFLGEILPKTKNLKKCLKIHYSISKGLFYRHDESESMDYLTIYHKNYNCLYIIYKDWGFIEILQIIEGNQDIEKLVNLYNQYDLILDPKREEDLFYDYEEEESFVFEKFSDNYKELKDKAGLAHINNQEEWEEILNNNIWKKSQKNIKDLKEEYENSKMKWKHNNKNIWKKKKRIKNEAALIVEKIINILIECKQKNLTSKVDEKENLGLFFYPNKIMKNENLINKNLNYLGKNDEGIIIYNNKLKNIYEINYDTLEFKLLKEDYKNYESKIVKQIANKEFKLL